MEADISIWRKTGHFYFALTYAKKSPYLDGVPRTLRYSVRFINASCRKALSSLEFIFICNFELSYPVKSTRLTRRGSK
jgi:hypothetical protein